MFMVLALLLVSVSKFSLMFMFLCMNLLSIEDTEEKNTVL